MFDQAAELAENRKLDELLNILASQNSEDEEPLYDSTDESNAEKEDSSSSGEDEGPISTSTKNIKIKFSDRQPTSLLAAELASVGAEPATELLNDITTLPNLMQHISFEEFDLITDCRDKDLKELMILNRAKHVQLKNLINKYNNLLVDCEKSLRYYWGLKTKSDALATPQSTNLKIGYPYFSVKKFGPASNADFYRKKAKGEINLFYSKTPRMYMRKSKLRRLQTCVKYNYYANYLHKSQKELDNLLVLQNSQDGEIFISSEVKTEIDTLSQTITNINNNDFSNIELPDFWDDALISWETIAEQEFDDVTLAPSLRALWNYYLHPKIVSSAYTKRENKTIINYVMANVEPDWSALAATIQSRFGTIRTEHQLCSYFMSALNQEDEEACEEISDAKVKALCTGRMRPNWNTLITSNNRTKTHLYNRYRYLKSMENRKSGYFTLEEDFKIVSLVKKHGTDFELISKLMPDRTKAQLRCRYESNLACDNKKYGNWSLEEDKIIWAHVQQHGEAEWQRVTSQLNRNAAQIRHHYRNVIKKHMSQPGAVLRTLPRKKQNYASLQKKKQLVVEHAATVSAASNFGLDRPPAVMQGRMRSMCDEKLVEFFAPTAQLKKTRNLKLITEEQLNDCTKTIKLVLGIFHATLDIPKQLTHVHGLDKIDVEILQNLRSEVESIDLANDNPVVTVTQPSLNILMPPNVSSAQALRYLLLKSFNTVLDWGRMNQTIDVENKEVQLFVERFNTFFKWPSLMSIVEPPELVHQHGSEVLAVQETEAPKKAVPVKRRGRPRKDNSKILKMAARRQEIKKMRCGNVAETGGDDQSQSQSDVNVSDAHAQTENCQPTNFTFENGALVPTNTPTVSNVTVLPLTTVLRKVDKATIDRLIQQNLISKIIPIKIFAPYSKSQEIVEKVVTNENSQRQVTNDVENITLPNTTLSDIQNSPSKRKIDENCGDDMNFNVKRTKVFKSYKPKIVLSFE